MNRAAPASEPSAAQLPRSATGTWTGPSGCVGGVLGGAVAFVAPLSSVEKAGLVVAGAGLAMVAVELLAYRRLERRRPDYQFSWKRILLKLLALYAIFGTGAALYWLLPVYAEGSYQDALQAGMAVLPWLCVAAIPYVIFTDARLEIGEDAYYHLGRLLIGRGPQDLTEIAGLLRGWLVKGFFLPLMFGFVVSDLNQIWSLTAWPDFPDFRTVFAHAYDWLYLIDVLIATVGYLTTLKLLDTHIRSAEPTVFGWIVCILCYPPFWDSIGSHYLAYDQDGVFWGAVFWNTPPLYIAWGSVILVLVAIYAWSTVAFGLRFSNLTHRGIIAHGPYRWTKHPAYLSKNITWWMISLPFFPATGDWGMALRSTILLIGVNVVYFLRARTEEQHLSADPVYRQYADYIAADGLFARLRRLAFRQKSAAPAPL